MSYHKASAILIDSRPSRRFFDFMVPLAILLALTALFRATELDLKLSAYFYTPEEGWKYASAAVCSFLYQYGAWPGLALSIFAGIVFVAGLFLKGLSIYRKQAMFFVLLLALGPGLIVNVVLKDHAGRPRPREVTVFGGSSQFLQVLDPGDPGEGQSFPSGHAAMGFFLAAPYFVLRRSSPGWVAAWLLLGLAAGSAIGIVRMAQGAHFASDIIWSWGVVHLCALSLSRSLNLEKPQRARRLPLPG